MAVANYEQTQGHVPPAFVLGPDGKPWHSWRVLILPYIEQDSLFKRYRFDEPWDGPNNRLLAREMPKTLAFTGTDRSTTVTNYLAVVGAGTMWPGATGRKFTEIKDGPSNTILIVENNGLGVHWMEPRDLAFDTMPFGIDSPDGVSSWYKYPAVVTADKEFLEAEMHHHVELILRHAAKRVVAVIGQPARFAAVAIAAQIGCHHREIFRQQRRDYMPMHVRKRIAVHQQQRRAIAADYAVYPLLRIAGLDIKCLETFKHGFPLWLSQPASI